MRPRLPRPRCRFDVWENLSTDTVSTLGTQRRLNYALQPMRKDEFIRLVTTDQPEAPPYFAYDAMLNRRERPTLAQTLQRELIPLTLDDVLRLMNTGAQVLDARSRGLRNGASHRQREYRFTG